MSAEDSIEIEFSSRSDPKPASGVADDVAHDSSDDDFAWLTALFDDDDEVTDDEVADRDSAPDGEIPNDDLQEDSGGDPHAPPVLRDTPSQVKSSAELSPPRALDREVEDLASRLAEELTAGTRTDHLQLDPPTVTPPHELAHPVVEPPPTPNAEPPATARAEPTPQPKDAESDTDRFAKRLPLRAKTGFREEILATFSHLYDEPQTRRANPPTPG